MGMRVTRLFVSTVAVLLALTVLLPAYASPSDYDTSTPQNLQEDYLYGESAVVIDGKTGEVLFSKNSRVRMYPASTTKIMTLLLAVESGVDFDTMVTIPAAAGDIPSDSSLIPVYEGETTTFGDLLYGMMIHSGNDGANAVAVLLAGSVDAFVEKMNQRALELGCEGTHFTNAHGYHNENHYSTAQDLALITREALKYESVRQIVSTTSYTMNVSPRGEVPLTSRNSLLNPASTYYFEECIGVKTGTHSKAGKCFVGAAEKDGVLLVSVTLNCAEDDQKWIDTIRLCRYGFTCYTPYTLEQMFEFTSSRIATVQVSNAHEDDPMNGVLQLEIAQVSNSEYERMVQTDNESAMTEALDDFVSRCEISITDNLVAPISMGEIIGSFSYTAQDGEFITASLIAGRDVEVQPDPITIYDVFPFLHIFDSMLVRMLILVLILLVISLVLYGRARRRRQERRRQEVYERRRREYLRRQRESAGRSQQSAYRRAPSTRRTASGGSRSGSTRKSSSAVQRRRKEDNLFGKF